MNVHIYFSIFKGKGDVQKCGNYKGIKIEESVVVKIDIRVVDT